MYCIRFQFGEGWMEESFISMPTLINGVGAMIGALITEGHTNITVKVLEVPNGTDSTSRVEAQGT